MNDFDSKWKRCVTRAREASPRNESAPFGFASRVVAVGFLPAGSALEPVWRRMALAWLACAVAGLVVCAILELPHLRDANLLNPGVEDTVARLAWRL